MAGFFDDEELQGQDRSEIGKFLGCSSCGLFRNCLSPKMPATGEGKLNAFLLGEAPGKEEDKKNTQFVGDAGQLLRRYITKACNKYGAYPIDLDRDFRKMNSCNCRPTDNETPKDNQIASCRPRVLEEIEAFKPRVIVLTGMTPVKSIIGHLWKKDLDTISKWRGWAIPDRYFNAWILPIYHPSFIGRKEKFRSEDDVAARIFERDIEQVVYFIKEKVAVPQYEREQDQIEILYDPDKIIRYLRGLIRRQPKLVAFDYETTGRKPHRQGHDIICSSISEGEDATVAFPMLKEVRRVFCDFLVEKSIGKIASNMKFETNWSRYILKCDVLGWQWDTMLNAHVLDNRELITSLKFQAYVRYGISDYDSHIEPFLKSDNDKDGNSFNRVREAPLHELLTYCGVDSLLERRVALDQRKEMKWSSLY